MKKIVSLILAGLLSVSLFAIGASAEIKTVPGAVGDDGVLPDGFSDPATGADINVKVNDVTHKYAVDITFSFDALMLGGLVWNVNEMRYDIESGTLGKTERTIEVSNRSDLPVYAYATVEDKDDKDNLTVAVDTYNKVGSKLEIKKATASATVGTGSGSATKGTLTVELNSDDWNAVAKYYIDKDGSAGQIIPVATVTVHISKD